MQATLDYTIIRAGKEWADKYREFCRGCFVVAYTRPDLGVNEGLFSVDRFNEPTVVRNIARVFTDPNNTVWLAVAAPDNTEIIGGVVLSKDNNSNELKLFYVKDDLQGQGVGKSLYAYIEKEAGDSPIYIDVVQYAKDAMKMYLKWGYQFDDRKHIKYDWVNWPQKALGAYYGIGMVKYPPHNVTTEESGI